MKHELKRTTSGAVMAFALMIAGLAAGEPRPDSPIASGEAVQATAVGGPAVMRRLTQTQYRNIVSDVFGESIKLGGRFEPEIRIDHLIGVGSGRASIAATGLEQYDRIARSVAEQVVAPGYQAEMLECRPANPKRPDEACARRFLTRVGLLIYRRPLTTNEVDAYVGASAAATRTSGDFYGGLSLALAGMLISPQFLFRQELAESDPEHPGQGRLDAYSKASRLSFLLWNTAPDPILLAAAGRGELHTAGGLAKQVDRLLASPRLEDGLRAFFTDMLEFDNFETLAKDAQLYPKFTFTAAAQAQEQTLRTLVQLLVRENGDYRDIFTTRKTFLTPLLASLYRVPLVVPDELPNAWVPYEFDSSSGQSGILTQASFVALHSHPGRSSPTLRGRAARELLLCTKVPDPPGDVNFNLVQDTSNPEYRTARTRLAAHATEPMCKGCHKITDPIGLALENFDTTGGYRQTENGALIDTAGELDRVKFTDAAGLGRAMYDNPRARGCMVERLYNYAVGREATRTEKAWRTEFLEKQFAASGYRLPALLRGLALSETFYRVIPSDTALASAAGPSDGERHKESRK